MKVLYKLSSLSAGSVTRRSAGLPFIVKTILASEACVKQVSYVFVGAMIAHSGSLSVMVRLPRILMLFGK